MENTTYVTTFILEDGVNDELTGPFVDAQAALAWIDDQIESMKHQYLNFTYDRSEDGEFTMFSDSDESDPHGYVYQVMTLSIPVEVVTGD